MAGALQGRVALVTGSTSGIGLSIARALAAEGADVALNGFGEPDEIEAIRAGLEREFGVRATHSGADMAVPEEIAAMVQAAARELGGLHVLVNNAGVQFVAPIAEFPAEQWDRILAVNLSAAFHAMKAAIPHLQAAGWGRIVSTASAHSLVASPFKSAYVAAKHGIAGLTKTAALELAPDGITVNAISPGYVWTPLVERQIPGTMRVRNLSREQVIQDVLLDAHPVKRFVTPEQVAALVVFLCGEAGSTITGANLSMDAGWTAR